MLSGPARDMPSHGGGNGIPLKGDIDEAGGWAAASHPPKVKYGVVLSLRLYLYSFSCHFVLQPSLAP